MKYKNLLIKLFPYFIAPTSIYTQENKYLKLNAAVHNYAPKVEINRDISTLSYSNLFILNNVDIKLNVKENLDNIFTNCYAMYKLNNKLCIVIDRGIKNSFTNILANYKLRFNKIMMQMGFTFRGGIHLGFTNTTNEDDIAIFTEQLSKKSRAVNSGTSFDNITFNDDGFYSFEIESNDSYPITHIVVSDNEFVNAETIDNHNLEFSEHHTTIPHLGQDNEFESAETIDSQSDSNYSLQTIGTYESYFPYNGGITGAPIHVGEANYQRQFYRVLSRTVKPIIKIEKIVEDLHEIQVAEDSNDFINDTSAANNISPEVYININQQLYHVLGNTQTSNIVGIIIQPTIRVEVAVLGVNHTTIGNGSMYYNVDDLNSEEYINSIIQIYENLRAPVIYPLINADIINNYDISMNSHIDSYIEEMLFRGTVSDEEVFFVRDIVVEEIFTFINQENGKINRIININNC